MTALPKSSRRLQARAWRRRVLLDAIAYCALGLASFMALFPLFWTLSTSVRQRADTFALPPRFFDFVPTLKNYLALFETPGFARIYLKTVAITFASTLLCVLVSTLAAYALARSVRFRGRGPLKVNLILVRAVPRS